MSWTRARAEHLSRRRIAPAVPAAIRAESGWVRAYVAMPVEQEKDTLEPDSWLRPAGGTV
ncbi:hypothetical protein GCM10017788_65710 [Amycolatopsis acidiphila]|uniref:Uncharacterized protein n=2 Tax=Amycolatopsis acidiphila TaxID=715473 RepID=A0A558ANB9_9PSEU|nr:hypothetical protein FNH06_02240 [Amycolatopsis acidiphila]GHG90401.1 hypothetical protein GCM10017788_65710 [Amycolatopsis acidiphila]